jgi:hypothetical protein
LYDAHVAELIDQAVWHVEHLSVGAHESVPRRATA